MGKPLSKPMAVLVLRMLVEGSVHLKPLNRTADALVDRGLARWKLGKGGFAFVYERGDLALLSPGKKLAEGMRQEKLLYMDKMRRAKLLHADDGWFKGWSERGS